MFVQVLKKRKSVQSQNSKFRKFVQRPWKRKFVVQVEKTKIEAVKTKIRKSDKNFDWTRCVSSQLTSERECVREREMWLKERVRLLIFLLLHSHLTLDSNLFVNATSQKLCENVCLFLYLFLNSSWLNIFPNLVTLTGF